MCETVDFNFSEDEEDAFKELKKKFGEKLEDNAENDFQFYRFLKDRNYDVTKAETLLNDHLEFRKTWKTDTILEDYKIEEPLLSHLPFSFLGYTKDGSPVKFLDGGNTDLIGIMKSVKKDDFIKYWMYDAERLQKLNFEQTLEKKTPVGVTVIVNGENLSFMTIANKTVLEFGIECLSLFDRNYPEFLQTAYFINVPIYFNYLFGIMKQILPSVTMQKIHVFGRDDWQSRILNLIDSEVLPDYLGGDRNHKDCKKNIMRGRQVPKHYYFSNSQSHLKNQPDVEKYTLGCRSKVNITHEVKTSGFCIEWQFETEDHDIGFGLLFKTEEEEETTELIPIERVKANIQREVGTFICENPGIYIMVFDNSYSWFRGKHIFIKSSVCKPQESLKIQA